MKTFENLKEIKKKSIKVEELFHDCKETVNLKLLNGEIGFENVIDDGTIHRPGLALSGYTELFTFYRVQVLGNTEIRFLNHLDYKDRLRAFELLFNFPIPCLILTNNNDLDEGILNLATKKGIPILGSTMSTAGCGYRLNEYLTDQFSPKNIIHGTFLDIYGIGILFVGRSGIGKSEIALDLVERGHRLVADDVVSVTRKGETVLMGYSNQLVKHYMEIRGLGLIDVRSIFGVRAVRYGKRLEVLVELEDWRDDISYSRTGLDDNKIAMLGIEIPHIKLPIFPGKNVTVISEVIALNYLLKYYGHDSAKEFASKLQQTILDKKNKNHTVSDLDYSNFLHTE